MAVPVLRTSFPVMGSVASLVLTLHGGEDRLLAAEAVRAARARLEEVETSFSLFRPDSELRRYREGRCGPGEPGNDLLEVLQACQQLGEQTDGWFHPFDAAGRFDPTGFVKGWAVDQAVELIVGLGFPNCCLGVGGDIRTNGWAEPSRPWRVAVRSPSEAASVAALVEAPTPGNPLAAATSGEYERGDHLWAGAYEVGRRPDQRRGRESTLGSVTVVGRDLAVSDALSTGWWALAQAQGPDSVLRHAERWPQTQVLLLGTSGQRWSS